LRHGGADASEEIAILPVCVLGSREVREAAPALKARSKKWRNALNALGQRDLTGCGHAAHQAECETMCAASPMRPQTIGVRGFPRFFSPF
jgi:hypothetical protein